MSGDFRARADAVRGRVDLAALIGRTVTLSRGRRPRGKCPFHGSKSDSFSVNAPAGYAHCFGCNWSGDAIKFVADIEGVTVLAALEALEADAGLAAVTSDATARREKQPAERKAWADARDLPRVDAIAVGRHIWAGAGPVARTRALRYLAARGVPAAMLTPDRSPGQALARTVDLRFHGHAPIVPWAVGEDAARVPHAPALVALMRSGVPPFDPVGVHVTWLTPDGTAKMARQRRDGSDYPARKMLGPAGGAMVVLGDVAALGSAVPLFVGEGIETVLSGMALCGADAEAVGVATLSLDNLQGGALLWKGGVWPLFDVRGDPDRPPVAFAHAGPVTGLIDADMKPLRGPGNRGFPVVEVRRGPIVARAITSAERTHICAQLFAQGWRRAGCHRVEAERAAMGMDFNDLARRAA